MIIRWSIVGALALLAVLADETQATCPTGWVTREGYCYFQSTAELAWNEAESYCQTQYAHLVSYVDAVERDWAFQTFISGSGSKWWIGMNDLANENTFVWTDPTTKTGREIGLWKIGEPNNDGDEDCITISDEVQQSSNGNWADAQCRKKRKYICKMKDAAVPDCDDANGFMKHGSYCYKYIDTDMSWHDGNDACRDKWNAELTAITSQDEQDFILSMMLTTNKAIWIGLSDSAVPNTLQWSNGHDSFTVSSYDNWAPSEPVIKYSGSACVQSVITGDGQWSVTLCGDTKPVICRKGLRATCPSGWTYAHGKCYEVILNQNFYLTWTEANTYCKAKNARLLEIKTEEEQIFIASYASSFSKEGILQIWLGISDVGHDDVLTWVDQDPVTFEHWDGTPVTRAGQSDCAQVYMGKGQDNWELTTCYSQQSFICEIHEGTPLSNIDTPEIYYACSKGWRLLPPYCYYFGDMAKNWVAAESFCNDPAQGGGHLASIHNSAQQSFISGHMTSYSWIGLNDRVLEGQYTWTDGTPYNFTSWRDGEPNNSGEGEDCTVVNRDGTWNDGTCTKETTFVCKRDAGIHYALLKGDLLWNHF